MAKYKAVSAISDVAQVRVALVQGDEIVSVTAVGLGQTLLGLDATPGIVVQTDADSFTKRTLTGTTGEIVVTNGSGVSGNPTVSLAAQGFVVDRAFTTYATNTNITTVIPLDDTIPLIGEGTEILTVSITPKTTTNRLRCRFMGQVSAAAAANIVGAMFQGSTCLNALYITTNAAAHGHVLLLEAEYVPGATSSQTISVRVGPGAAGTIRLNGSSAARTFGGAQTATLVVEEIKA